MLHRNTRPGDMHEGKWVVPGGKMLPGESPESCVIREVMEETGLTISEPHLKGFFVTANPDGSDSWNVFVFITTQVSGEWRPCPEGTLEWIEDSRIKDLPMWGGDKDLLKYLDMPGFFSARFVYDGKKVVDHSVRFY